MPIPILLAGLLAISGGLCATRSHRTDALARYGVGLLRVRADRPAAALPHLERAAKSGAAAPKADLARLYAELARPAAATRLAREAVAADPGDFVTGRLLAKLRLDAGRTAEAVAALRLAAASPRLVDPDRKADVLTDLARAADAAADWPALEEAARALIALKPGAAELGAAHERLGRSLEKRGQFAAARDAYRSATPPNARRAWLLSGVLLAEGRDAEALEELQKALRAKPAGVEPYARLVELLARMGRAERLAPALDALAEQNPANPHVPWLAAEALARTDAAAAWARFQSLATSTASAPGAARLVRFALTADREGELLDLLDESASAARGARSEEAPGEPRDAGGRAAVERFRALADAAKADPGAAKLLAASIADGRLAVRHTQTRDLLALLAERLGQPAALGAVLAAGAGGNPALRVTALFRQRKWAEALELCDELEANPPRRRGKFWPFFDLLRATAHHELGRTDAALRALDAAQKAGLGELDANLRRAAILADTGRADEAVRLCERVLTGETRPDQQLDARLRLASALADAGRYAESDRQYDLARDLDPDSALVWNNYGYNLADQNRRLADAEAMLRHAVELSRDERARLGAAEPAQGTYLDSLAWVLFRRGKLAESRELFAQAVRTLDGVADGVVWDHAGDVHARLGDLEQAKAAWRKAAELYADTHQGRKDGRADEARRKLEGR